MHELDFNALLSPLSAEHFLAEYWESRPMDPMPRAAARDPIYYRRRYTPKSSSSASAGI